MHSLAKVAIAYDFDGTLASGNMQEPHFLKDIGVNPDDFWAEVRSIAQKEQADQVLIYMLQMLTKANEAGIAIHRDDFKKTGIGLKFFKGVRGWFERINNYANYCGLQLEHYLISSGNAEIFAGTPIAHHFTDVYASKFLFNEQGLAIWPAQAVNYTTKTQYLFRINKGVHDLSDNKKINEFIPKAEREIPFTNMIYIGDGETDIPCFRLVREQGGLSIAVYQPDQIAAKQAAQMYVKQGRVHTVHPANYTDGSPLDKTVKARLDYIAASTKLQNCYSK